MEEEHYQDLVINQLRRDNAASVIEHRLDTQTLLNKIELYIRGKVARVHQDKDGNLVETFEDLGRAKMNDEGTQSILNWIGGVADSAIVQGNFPADRYGYSEKYEDWIEEFHLGLLKDMMRNCDKWKIKDEDIEGIIDFIMSIVIPFMTRLIGNKERESYGESMRTIDNTRPHQSSGFNPFKKN